MTYKKPFSHGTPAYTNLSFALGAESDVERLASLAADCGVPSDDIDVAIADEGAHRELRSAILEAVAKRGGLPDGWRQTTEVRVVVNPDFEPEEGDHLDAIQGALDFCDIPAWLNATPTLLQLAGEPCHADTPVEAQAPHVRELKVLDALEDASNGATDDWHLVLPEETGNENIEIHDAYGRTATVYGEMDEENFDSANLMVLGRNHMQALVTLAKSMVALREACTFNHPGVDPDSFLLSTLRDAVASEEVLDALARLQAPVQVCEPAPVAASKPAGA